jgi:hypothetical protein
VSQRASSASGRQALGSRSGRAASAPGRSDRPLNGVFAQRGRAVALSNQPPSKNTHFAVLLFVSSSVASRDWTKIVSLPVIVSLIGLGVAVLAVVAGVASLGLGELEVISDDASASLGVTSILCSLIAIPIGVVGWRWAERRRQQSVLGQAAGLIGWCDVRVWFVLFVYALGQDTP